MDLQLEKTCLEELKKNNLDKATYILELFKIIQCADNYEDPYGLESPIINNVNIVNY